MPAVSSATNSNCSSQTGFNVFIFVVDEAVSPSRSKSTSGSDDPPAERRLRSMARSRLPRTKWTRSAFGGSAALSASSATCIAAGSTSASAGLCHHRTANSTRGAQPTVPLASASVSAYHARATRRSANARIGTGATRPNRSLLPTRSQSSTEMTSWASSSSHWNRRTSCQTGFSVFFFTVVFTVEPSSRSETTGSDVPPAASRCLSMAGRSTALSTATTSSLGACDAASSSASSSAGTSSARRALCRHRMPSSTAPRFAAPAAPASPRGRSAYHFRWSLRSTRPRSGTAQAPIKALETRSWSKTSTARTRSASSAGRAKCSMKSGCRSFFFTAVVRRSPWSSSATNGSLEPPLLRRLGSKTGRFLQRSTKTCTSLGAFFGSASAASTSAGRSSACAAS
mmetsp:Transcript_14408/g.50134  ORF Transcript_14408/g.50134 Transcript_14408/m.50134 type:complete len:399 (-) Transcript_14408:570-1766(-)